jgi:indolepyruvate ferredoxin oxidoreductase alpha subunit
MQEISVHSERSTRLLIETEGRASRLGIIATGVPFQMVHEILLERGIRHVPLLKLDMPHPFPLKSVQAMMARCRHVLVLEEPDAFVEFHLPRRERVLGRASGHVPSEGELLPETVWNILDGALRESGRKGLPASRSGTTISMDEAMKAAQLPQRRPTLCAGCPHRASFYAIKRAFPKAVFTSDIGCYTLGSNLGGVDTVLDMGSGITLASGLFQAFHQDGVTQPIIATMGDSTFYHSGTAALINAVYNRAQFVLVLLDNGVTAMTGMQPTPAWDWRVNDSPGTGVPLERVVAGCGVDFIKVHDPYDVKGLIKLLKRAQAHAVAPNGGVAVVIARHPCMIEKRRKGEASKARFVVTEKCEGCGHCMEAFECPALLWDPEQGAVRIEPTLCAGCGVCLFVCPRRAIRKAETSENAP